MQIDCSNYQLLIVLPALLRCLYKAKNFNPNIMIFTLWYGIAKYSPSHSQFITPLTFRYRCTFVQGERIHTHTYHGHTGMFLTWIHFSFLYQPGIIALQSEVHSFWYFSLLISGVSDVWRWNSIKYDTEYISAHGNRNRTPLMLPVHID